MFITKEVVMKKMISAFIICLTAFFVLSVSYSLLQAQGKTKIERKPDATYQQQNPQLRMTCVGGTVVFKNRYVPGSGTEWLPWPQARIMVTDRNGKRVGSGVSRKAGKNATYCIEIPAVISNVDIEAGGIVSGNRPMKALARGVNLQQGLARCSSNPGISPDCTRIDLQGYPLSEFKNK